MTKLYFYVIRALLWVEFTTTKVSTKCYHQEAKIKCRQGTLNFYKSMCDLFIESLNVSCVPLMYEDFLLNSQGKTSQITEFQPNNQNKCTVSMD